MSSPAPHIRFRCRHCGQTLKVPASAVGKSGKCPNAECGQAFVVPTVSEPPPAVAPPDSGASRKPTVLPGRKPSSRPKPAPPPEDDFSDLLGDSEGDPESELASPKSSPKGGKKKRKKNSSKSVWWIAGALACLAVFIAAWALFPSAKSTGELTTADQAPASLPQPDFATEIQPFFKQYCFDCHGPDTQEAGLELHRDQALADVIQNRKRWEKVYGHVRIGAMPPSSSPQPKTEERDKVVAWLDHALHFVDCSGGADPGKVTIRRLNRAEYNNTIRDLLGVDFDASQEFPTDDVGYGFDNIGDVLSVQPLLLEKYLNAAEQIAERAIPSKAPNGLDRTITGQQLKPSNKLTVNPLPHDAVILITRCYVSTDIQVARDGEYTLEIRSGATPFKPKSGGAQMEVKLDGKVIQTIEVNSTRDKTQSNDLKLTLSNGQHELALAFLNDDYERDEQAKKTYDRNLIIERIRITGPKFTPNDLPPLQKVLVQNRPSKDQSFEDAVRKNLKPLVRRAFRRPVNDGEIEPFVKIAKLANDRQQPFEKAMQVALQGVLVSPQFLFRIEDPATNPGVEKLSQHELAVRLSYFLWSSMPDDELFQLANQGKLNDNTMLSTQVERMLKDPRSAALVENFAGQWLALRKLFSEEVSPDPDEYPDFNDQLRKDMATETKLFFASILRENRSLVDLLDARYSYLNERLAKLYGMNNIKGDEFRRVDLTDGHRAGVLTQASVLTLTSYPTRTSPVKRGEWILANILGDEPPPPPPVVPALEETQKSNPNLPFREQLILHRKDPGCAACHVLMDDLGFGFENFDGIGRWREKIGPHPVDSSGVLPGGQKFQGPMELVAILKTRQREFAHCLTEKMLTYALGRGLEYYDKCAIDGIVSGVERDQLRLSALVREVVLSEPFRKKRGVTPP